LAISLGAGRARAQSAPPVSVTLEYAAFEGCPDAASFEAQVLARTSRASFAAPGASGTLTWIVELGPTSGGSRGTLRVQGESQGTLERNVTAATCEQVVGALALVAALSVDPEASLSEPAKPSPRPAPSPPKPPAPVPPRRPRERVAAAPAVRFLIGLSLVGRSGLAPELVWAPEPALGLSFRTGGGHTWGLRLSALHASSGSTVGAARASFTSNLVRLQAFPLRVGSATWRFEPAAFAEAGELSARGVGITPAHSVRRPVAWAGVLGRVSLAMSVLLLELEAGGALPFVRDRFYVFENTTVFRVPPASAFASLGVGLEF
jgi:hypothetical protein